MKYWRWFLIGVLAGTVFLTTGGCISEQEGKCSKSSSIGVVPPPEEFPVTGTNSSKPAESERPVEDYISAGVNPELWEWREETGKRITPQELTSISDWSSIGRIYEAEDAKRDNLSFFSREELNKLGTATFSGTGGVGVFDNGGGQTSVLTFLVDIEEAGGYDLIFLSTAFGEEKLNSVIVNGTKYTDCIHTLPQTVITPSVLTVPLKQGINMIQVVKGWGSFYLDALVVRKGRIQLNREIYRVIPKLSNPNADDCVRRLMKYFTDIYGEYTLAGQYARGKNSYEAAIIHKVTGRYPAITGYDFMDYSPSRVEHGTKSTDVEKAIEWWQEDKGIVTFCWHWNAPKDLPDTAENPWHSGFYTRATTFDLEKAMNGQDPEGYEMILRDIDAIAVQLQRLNEAGVPVLWRPLHEASGGWFWWGAHGPEPYIKLYRLMYDRLTNLHKLNNLLWVWNGQNKDWYPGDDVVDMIGDDIYPPEREYNSQRTRFEAALDATSERKLIALSENGTLPDIDAMYREKVCWLWFATWYGDFVFDKSTHTYEEKYNDAQTLKDVYNSPKVITLDELPDLVNYPLD